MEKKRENPEQWLPPEALPDIDCTLLQLWSRYHQEIAVYRGFISPENTISSYTASLKKVEIAANQKLACRLNAYDVWDIVVSILYRTSGKYIGMPYATSTLETRLTVIKDIYLYLEANGIMCNPLWFSPWELTEKFDWSLSSGELKDTLASLRATVLEKNKRGALPISKERKLVLHIVAELEYPEGCIDGRWVGMGVYLYHGPRPSEGRALKFRDLKNFPRCTERYIDIARSSYEDGTEKERGKNANFVRRIPMHIEFEKIISLWEEQVQRETGVTCLDDYPVFCCGQNYSVPCTSTQLAIFSKEKLKKLLTSDELKDAAIMMHTDVFNDDSEDNNDDASANRALSTYILRHNFITKSYSETQLRDTDIRRNVGHIVDDYKYDYALPAVRNRQIKANHRLIVPELRADWHSTISAAGETFVTNRGKHYFKIPKDFLESGGEFLLHLEGLEVGDDLRVEFQRALPREIDIEIQYSHIPAEFREPHRLNTDYDHWLLSWPKKDDEN